jgi:hypothetical protein
MDAYYYTSTNIEIDDSVVSSTDVRGAAEEARNPFLTKNSGTLQEQSGAVRLAWSSSSVIGSVREEPL